MDSSPFAKLPRELRDIIYSIVLSRGMVTIDLKPPQIIESSPPSHTLALICTCKQIAKEVHDALPVHFYAKNTFVFSTRKPHCVQRSTTMDYFIRDFKELYSVKVNQWLRCIGPVNFNTIKAVKFELWELELLLERSIVKPRQSDGPETPIPNIRTLGDFVRLFRTNALGELEPCTATIRDRHISVTLPPCGSCGSMNLALDAIRDAFANSQTFDVRTTLHYGLEGFVRGIWGRTYIP